MICCVRSRIEGAREDGVIEMRRAQISFGDGLIAEEVSDLREGWMEHADRLLVDEQIIAAVYEALARRHPKSRGRGRLGAPAEMVLRLLILKHIRNWSYGVLEREVRANLVYRDFTRVGAGKTPDAKTMGRWGLAVGPEVVKQIHQRLVKLAQANGLAAGRRMRVDTTVVETNVHYPTDSSLLGDGVRVLIRTMKRIGKIAGETGVKLCDRSRSVKLRVLDIARAARSRAKQSRERLNRSYGKLLDVTSRSGGTGEAVLRRDRRGNEAREERPAAAGARRPAPRARRDGAAGQASDEADESTYLPRRRARRRKDPQLVRAIDGDHSQRQGRQAE
jgi:transposase, IS5 family